MKGAGASAATLLLVSIALGCTGPGSRCEGDVTAAPAELSAPDRSIVGIAAAYPADRGLPMHEDELERSLAARRELGWSVAERALQPVDLSGSLPNSDPDQATVPAFATWYDVEDLGRIFRHLNAARAPEAVANREPFSEAELDEAFEWNVRSVDEMEAWPLDRLTAYVEAVDTRESVHGVGGISRVLYSPSAARHVLANYASILGCRGEAPPPALEEPPSGAWVRRDVSEAFDLPACGTRAFGPYFVAGGGVLEASSEGDIELAVEGGEVCAGRVCRVEGPATVTLLARALSTVSDALRVAYDAPDPDWASCLEAPFPPDAAIAKADYRRVGFGVTFPVYDTSAGALSALAADDFDWGVGVTTAEPSPDEVHTVELANGNAFRLAGLHLMSKELDHWVWVTLFWSASPNTDFGADRPARLSELAPPWGHYKMCAVTAFSELDADPTGGAIDGSLADASSAVHRGVGGATWCSNPYLEEGPGNAATNCVGCHQHAGTGSLSEDILADPGRFGEFGVAQTRNNFPTDYVFAAGSTLPALFAR